MPQPEKSEEIIDIIERMPTTFGNWLLGLLVLILTLVFFVSWFVKYPDTIEGEITINSINVPIRLVAATNGQLDLLVKPSQTVSKGELLAVIKNPASVNDVMSIKKDLKNINIQALESSVLVFSAKKSLQLGDIEFKYVAFLNACNDFQNFNNNNLFDRQTNDFYSLINEQNRSLEQKKQVRGTRDDAYMASFKELQAQGTLLNKKIISKSQYEQVRANYLRNQENLERIEDEIISTQVQIKDLQNKLGQTEIQKQQKSSELKVQLLATYKELLANVVSWEQRYAFVSPIDGVVEFLQFWNNEQFVNAGQEIFSVVSNRQNKGLKGEVVLPAIGLGKLKAGQQALIYLNDYPSDEYGIVEGQITKLSAVSSTSHNAEGGVMYLNMAQVTLKHSQELITDHDVKLPFKPSMKGRVSIVTEDKRLLQRCFESFKALKRKR